MRASGCRGTKGTKNKRKRGLNGRARHVLGCMVTAANNGKCAGMLGVGQRGQWGGMEWKHGVRRAYMTQMSNGKTKNKQRC